MASAVAGPAGEWTDCAVHGVRRRLSSAKAVPELLADAVLEATSTCGFSRGMVLQLRSRRVSVDPAVHRLLEGPHRELAGRVPTGLVLRPGSAEHEVVVAAEGGRPVVAAPPGALADALGLGAHVVVPIVPEARAVALLVLDRPGPGVTDADRARAGLFGHLLAAALEHVVLRARLHDLSREIQLLTRSATALMDEARRAPITAGATPGQVALFLDVGETEGGSPVALTRREREIGRLVAAGRSNPEIGQELFLSTNTVKGHVARLFRKLGASNRVEAAALFAASHSGGPHGTAADPSASVTLSRSAARP